jgi:hypothetical protein
MRLVRGGCMAKHDLYSRGLKPISDLNNLVRSQIKRIPLFILANIIQEKILLKGIELPHNESVKFAENIVNNQKIFFIGMMMMILNQKFKSTFQVRMLTSY